MSACVCLSEIHSHHKCMKKNKLLLLLLPTAKLLSRIAVNLKAYLLPDKLEGEPACCFKSYYNSKLSQLRNRREP